MFEWVGRLLKKKTSKHVCYGNDNEMIWKILVQTLIYISNIGSSI